MDVSAALLSIHESDATPAAYAALARTIAPPLRGVLRIADESVAFVWPDSIRISVELIDTAAHLLRPEVFGVGSQFPTDAANFPDADALLIPYRVEDEATVSAVLIGDAGAFGEDAEPWLRLGETLCRAERRERALERLRSECALLRQRAEESEALHTLGLATNRSLDPEEVLALVARFGRTLLGAHYATVSTVHRGGVQRVAAIGLRNEADAPGDDALAARVVEAGKPVRIGGPDATCEPADFPLHEREGMVVGLGVPLTLFGDTFGTLLVGYRRPYDVTPRDVRLAITVATQAAVAIGNARLHERVEQRSTELADAYEQLDHATRAKERFYNAVSHDLRTPVGAIKGYSELLLDGLAGELPSRARRFVENSARAAETLLALLNDLLDFAKLQANRMDVDLQPTVLQDVIDDALLSVRPQADAGKLQLVEPQIGDITLVTDARRLRQIIVNLLSNAVKFTSAGTIGIECEHGPSWIELQVFDSGPGIAAEDRERIFKEFEQIKGSAGTGLGLPICRNLATLLGGSLRLESEMGVGSRFILRLPLERHTAGSGAADTEVTDTDEAAPGASVERKQPRTGRVEVS